MAWNSIYSTGFQIEYLLTYENNLCWKYTNTNNEIYIWDGVSESATQIFTLADSHSTQSNLSKLVKFKGNLYLSLAGSFNNGDPGCRVYRYNGTPHSWSEVLSAESESGGVCGYTMTATNNIITIDISDTYTGYDKVVKSSVDGTNWENDAFNQDWTGGVYPMFSDIEGNIYGETWNFEGEYLLVKLVTGNTWNIHTNLTDSNFAYTTPVYSQNNGYNNIFLQKDGHYYYYENGTWQDSGYNLNIYVGELQSIDNGESSYTFVSNRQTNKLYYWNTNSHTFEIYDDNPFINYNVNNITFLNNTIYCYSNYHIFVNRTIVLPVITSIPAVLAYVGVEYVYNITTTGNVTSITATYPNWLEFTDNEDGSATLIGTPTSDDITTFLIHISAINANGENTQDYSITVIGIQHKILSMSIPITSNTMVLCTEYSEDYLILSNKNSVIWGNQVIISDCTIDQLETTYSAYVLALDTATYYIYGRFNHPTLGLCQIIKTEDNGETWSVVVNDWGTHKCCSLLFDRQTYKLYAIRESSTTHVLYKGATKLVSTCIIPIGEGCTIGHGNFVMDGKKNLYVASYNQNEIVAMKSLAPGYSEWVDITYNHDVNGINRIITLT